MKLVIPLAGWGSRLRPLTWTEPKPLINVAGKPFLGHLLDEFAALDVEELVVIYGWLGDKIKAYLRTHYPNFRTQFVEQRKLKGQSHALWLAREYLYGQGIITYVDTYFEADLGVLTSEDADGVVFIREVEDPRRFGVVELDQDGFITRFVEKPDSMANRKAVIGLYWIRDLEWLVRCIEKQMASQQMLGGEFYLSDALQIQIDEGARFLVQYADVWQDAGKPETTLQTNRYLLEHGRDNSAEIDAPGGVIVPPVYVGSDVTIENAVVGPYANIVAGATIRNAVVRDSIIEADAVIEDVILEGSLIGEKAHVKGRPMRLNIGHSAVVGEDYTATDS